MSRDKVVSPSRRVEGRLEVPGDKSISHRALIVGAMGEGTMAITGLSPALDVASSLEAVKDLGLSTLESNVRVESIEPLGRPLNSQIVLESRGIGAWRRPESVLNVGNSGTTIRMLLGALAGSSIDASLTGDESILRRPMDRVVEPLRRMGADITGEKRGARAPLHVQGASLHGVEHTLPVASAQVKSALLLAGLCASGETVVSEPTASRDHTERLLRYLGIPIDSSLNRLTVKSTNIQNASVDIPGDLSSAAFFLVAAAMLPSSDITITDVGLNETRTGILEVLQAFGALVETTDIEERGGEPVGTVRVKPGD